MKEHQHAEVGMYHKPPTPSSLRQEHRLMGRGAKEVRARVDAMLQEIAGLEERQEANWAWLTANVSDPEFTNVMRETNVLAGRVEVLKERIANLKDFRPEMGFDMPTYSLANSGGPTRRTHQGQ